MMEEYNQEYNISPPINLENLNNNNENNSNEVPLVPQSGVESIPTTDYSEAQIKDENSQNKNENNSKNKTDEIQNFSLISKLIYIQKLTQKEMSKRIICK